MHLCPFTLIVQSRHANVHSPTLLLYVYVVVQRHRECDMWESWGGETGVLRRSQFGVRKEMGGGGCSDGDDSHLDINYFRVAIARGS